MTDSLRILQIIREGGGTPGVELRVAEKLRSAGHRVRIAGSPEVRPYVERAGFPYLELPWPGPNEQYGDESLIPQMLQAAEPWARQLADIARTEADILISDTAVFAGPLAARMTGLPVVTLMPTIYVGDQFASGPATELVHPTNQLRERLGLPPVATFLDQFLDVDRMLMLTARAFEPPGLRTPSQLSYVGPQLPAAEPGIAEDLIPAGSGPLVVVGLSTSEQGQRDLLGRIVKALQQTDARAVITVGPAVDPADFPSSERIRVYDVVPHARLLPVADAVITHAGHGTVLAALTVGVPLLCLPMGRDQPEVAARVARHGAGLVLDPESSVDEILVGLTRVLSEPGFRTAARGLAAAIARHPDDQVVREIEQLSRRDLS